MAKDGLLHRFIGTRAQLSITNATGSKRQRRKPLSATPQIKPGSCSTPWSVGRGPGSRGIAVVPSIAIIFASENRIDELRGTWAAPLPGAVVALLERTILDQVLDTIEPMDLINGDRH